MNQIRKTPAQEVWPQREFSQKGGKLITVLLPVFVYSLVPLIRLGSNGNQYVLMIIGSLLSVLGVISFTATSYLYSATNRKSFIAVFFTFIGFMPYIFGCYLTFYQGFWGFSELRYGFSFWVLFKAIASILIGYIIVSKLYELTELDRKFAKMAKEKTN